MATSKQISCPITIGDQGVGSISIGKVGNPIVLPGLTPLQILQLDGTNNVFSGTVSAASITPGVNGQILTTAVGVATWANPSAVPGIVSSFSASTTGLTPAVPTSGAIVLAGTLVAVNGGTGHNTYTIGDILYADSATTLSRLADVATGNALISGGIGVIPTWGKISLTAAVSGILPLANGGTNANLTAVAGGVVYSTAGALAITAAGLAGQVLTSNAALAPTWTTISAGVTTVGAISTTSTANAASIAGSTITMHYGSSANPGVGHIATWEITDTTIGYLSYPQYGMNTMANTNVGYNAFGAAGALTGTGIDNTSVGAFSLSNATSCSFNCCLGTRCGEFITSGDDNMLIGRQSFGFNLTTGADNVGLGFNSGLNGSGSRNLCIGTASLSNMTTGNDNIGLGYNCSLGTDTDTNCMVLGSNAVGNGSNSTTLAISYLQAGAGDSNLTYNTATGEIRYLVSSERYKNPLPDPPVDQFTSYLYQLTPRAFTLKNDPTNRPMVGYYAEEVADIKGPLGNSVFASLLNYTTEDDLTVPPILVDKQQYNPTTQKFETIQVSVPAKKTIVNGINYRGFVIPIIALCKQFNTRITTLESQLTTVLAEIQTLKNRLQAANIQ